MQTGIYSDKLREAPFQKFFTQIVFLTFYGQKRFFVNFQLAITTLQMIRMLWKSMEAIFGPSGTCHLKMTYVAFFNGRIFCVKLWQALCDHHLTGFGWKWQKWILRLLSYPTVILNVENSIVSNFAQNGRQSWIVHFDKSRISAETGLSNFFSRLDNPFLTKFTFCAITPWWLPGFQNFFHTASQEGWA